MPGSRRPPSRLQATPPPVNVTKQKPESAASASGEDRDANGLSSAILPPKHVHLPYISLDSNLIFELMSFVFSVMSIALQYINLYKTVWWLPHSHANYALNFYLIDPYLVMFLVILMSRRLVWCFIKEVCVGPSHGCWHWFLQIIKLSIFASLLTTFCWTAYHVVLRHTLLYTLFLCYPLVMYVILFGFRLNFKNGKGATKKETPKHKMKEPIHLCSNSPETIREEVDTLKTDFNRRVKHVLFNSIVAAYYMAFIPLCFAQHVENNCDTCWNTLYYDVWWVGQHVCLVWVSAFVMYSIHYLPAKYVDILHSCALHLGRWVKVEGRHAHVPYNAWSELQVWQQGSTVKHVRGLFKAEGINNAAEPGNSMHARFYFLFHGPLRLTNWLLVTVWGLVLYQFVLLIQATEWSHIINLAFLLFANYYMLFKLMRDRIVLSRAYKEEQSQSQ